MAELFRYIEQAFVVPSATPAIDVGGESDLQNSLRSAISAGLPPDRIRRIASDFILKYFSSPVADPFHLGKQLLSFGSQLFTLPSPGTHAVEQLISSVFSSDAHSLVASSAFVSDKALLDDALVSVKLVTAFDRVNAANLVAMRQAIEFMDDFDAGKVTDFTAEAIRATLRRPIRIPLGFVESLTSSPQGPLPPRAFDPADDAVIRHRTALMAEQRDLKTVYDTIMGLPPSQFELKPLKVKAERPSTTAQKSSEGASASAGSLSTTSTVNAAHMFLAVPQGAIERLGGTVRQTLEKGYIDASGAPVSDVITAIKRRWQDVSRQLAPYQVPAPARVFRVGVHLFAVQDSAAATARGTKEAL